MNGKEQEVVELLVYTAKAHHTAYFEVDGYDPEWPIWYANYSFDQIKDFLSNNFTKSEYIYALVHLSKVQPIEAPNDPWGIFYARFLLNEYC